MLSSLVEAQARARHEVLHRSRHKDLACCGKCSDPCGNVDGDASHVRFSNLDLAGMQAAANFNVQWADSLGNRASTADRASWPVESGKKSVSKRSNFAAPVTREFASHGGVMSVQQIVPAVVTHFLGPRGRAHNVCEQNGRKKSVGSQNKNFPSRRVRGNVSKAADYSTSAPRSLTQQMASAR